MRGIKLGKMNKLMKMVKDVDRGFPAFSKLLDDAIEDFPKKAERIINSAVEGFEKLFSFPFAK